MEILKSAKYNLYGASLKWSMHFYPREIVVGVSLQLKRKQKQRKIPLQYSLQLNL